MSNRAQASAATATGDTVKTLIDTLTAPSNMRRIIGAWCYAVAGAGLTTLENMTGIFELESDDLGITPLQLPLDCVTIVTSGSAAFSPRVWPLDIEIGVANKFKGYVTMDMAITIGSKARFGLIYSDK